MEDYQAAEEVTALWATGRAGAVDAGCWWTGGGSQGRVRAPGLPLGLGGGRSRRPAERFAVTHRLADSGRLRPALGAGGAEGTLLPWFLRERAPQARTPSSGGATSPGDRLCCASDPLHPRPPASPDPLRPSVPCVPGPPRPPAPCVPRSPASPAFRVPPVPCALGPPLPPTSAVTRALYSERRPLPKRMGEAEGRVCVCRLMFASLQSDRHT